MASRPMKRSPSTRGIGLSGTRKPYPSRCATILPETKFGSGLLRAAPAPVAGAESASGGFWPSTAADFFSFCGAARRLLALRESILPGANFFHVTPALQILNNSRQKPAPMMLQLHSVRDLPDTLWLRNRGEISDNLLFGHVTWVLFLLGVFRAFILSRMFHSV